jgi:RNA polymerase sigma-70 factor (ECF subfamily)
MDSDYMVSRFARTIRRLLVPHVAVPTFDDHPDPEIARVEFVFTRLPKRTRDIFLMHRFDDLGYEQIAHRLDINVKAVERHMTRALCAIRNAREEHRRQQKW